MSDYISVFVKSFIMSLEVWLILIRIYGVLSAVFLQVPCVEVVQAYIDRIQDVNPLVNAVIQDRQDRLQLCEPES